jgi:hypothetical protein
LFFYSKEYFTELDHEGIVFINDCDKGLQTAVPKVFPDSILIAASI